MAADFSAFLKNSKDDFKCTIVVEHQILLGDTKPIRKPPCRTPYALREEMKNQLQKMLDTGVIRPIDSPWAAPGILVPKKGAQTENFSTGFVWISEL